MKWQKEEIEFLKESYPSNVPLKEILNKLKRSKRSVSHKAVRLGIFRPNIPLNRPKDLEHRKIYDRNYYKNNREVIYKRKLNRLKSYKLDLANILGGKCTKCGYNKCVAALEFHHNQGNKEAEVTVFIKNTSKQKALKEAKKCILLCANCHRELHYKGP